MNLLKGTVLAAGAAFALSGCGVSTLLELADRAEGLESLETSVLNAATTTDISGRSGTASYTGQAALAGEVSEDQVAGFSAKAGVDVDFDAATVSGSLTELIGSDLTPEEVASIEDGSADLASLLSVFAPASGSVAIENGTIAGTAVTADTNGTVTMKGIEYIIAGGVLADFKGTNAEGLAFEQDTDFSITRDGVALSDPTFVLLAQE